MVVCILSVLSVVDEPRLVYLKCNKLVEELWFQGYDAVGLLEVYGRFWVSPYLRHQSSLWWQ